MIPKLFSSVTFLTLVTFCTFSQGTDNQGKELFVVKTQSPLSFPLTTNSIGFSYIGKTDSFTNKNNLNTYFLNSSLAQFIIDNTPDKDYFYDLLSNLNVENIETLKKGYETNKGDSIAIKTSELLLKKEIINNLNTIRGLSISTIHYLISKKLPVEKIYHVTDVGNWNPLKIDPIIVNLKVSNLSFKSLSNFLTSSNQPTIQAEFGHIINTVTKFNDWKTLKHSKSFLWFHEYDLFWSVFANTSCISYYDTINHYQTKTNWQSIFKFGQFGLKINGTGYVSKVLAVAVTLSTFYGLPLDNDKTYQTTKSNPTSRSDTIFFVTGQAAGKYGGSINSQSWNGRISLAIPIFLNFFTESGNGSTYLLPSYASFGSFNSHWTHQVGFSVNLLNKPYGGANTSIVQAGGIGFDILTGQTHTGWQSPIFYVSGTISLASLFFKNGTPSPIKK